MVSSSAPVEMVSSPASPETRSSSSPVDRLSLLFPPWYTSWPAVPVSVVDPGVVVADTWEEVADQRRDRRHPGLSGSCVVHKADRHREAAVGLGLRRSERGVGRTGDHVLTAPLRVVL